MFRAGADAQRQPQFESNSDRRLGGRRGPRIARQVPGAAVCHAGRCEQHGPSRLSGLCVPPRAPCVQHGSWGPVACAGRTFHVRARATTVAASDSQCLAAITLRSAVGVNTGFGRGAALWLARSWPRLPGSIRRTDGGGPNHAHRARRADARRDRPHTGPLAATAVGPRGGHPPLLLPLAPEARRRTGLPRRPTTFARWQRRRWPTWSATKSKQPTGVRTCSSVGGGSWTIGRPILVAGLHASRTGTLRSSAPVVVRNLSTAMRHPES